MKKISLFLCFLVFMCFSKVSFAEFKPLIEEIKTNKGINAYLIKDTKYPIVAVTVYFKTGYVDDDIEGLSNLVASTLDEGALEYNSKDFNGILFDNGIKLSFSSSKDIFSISLDTLSDKKDLAFNMLSLAMKSPRFDEDAVERIKSQIKTGIKMSLKDQSDIASKSFKENAFKDTYLVKDNDGTIESVDKITKSDLKEYVKTRFAIDNMYVGVVGDISKEELIKLLDNTFDELPLKSLPSKAFETKVKLTENNIIKVDYNSPQSVILFGSDGIKRLDKDYYGALILNYVLGGGGFSSRLVSEVREKKGLVYGISTWLDVYENAPLIMGYASTGTDNVNEAISIIKDEWEKIKNHGISDKELKNAKDYLIGSYPFKFNSSSTLSAILASIQIQNLGIDYFTEYNQKIENVTTDDLKRISKNLFDKDKILFTIIGKN